MKEIWKPIKEYEDLYEVSNKGRIRSFWRRLPKILNPPMYSTGYKILTLCKKGEIHSRSPIHRLVATAFLKNPKNYPIIHHKDGNKLNNNVFNLEWCTHSHNKREDYRLGIQSKKGEYHHRAKLTNEEVIYIRWLYEVGDISHQKIADLYNIKRKAITDIINRKNWKHI